MITLLDLSGTGSLHLKDGRHCPIDYTLLVTQSHGLKEARGTLEGGETGVLFSAMTAHTATLKLADGREFDIMLTSADSRSAQFRANHVPGV